MPSCTSQLQLGRHKDKQVPDMVFTGFKGITLCMEQRPAEVINNDWSIIMCGCLFVGLPGGSLVFWQMSIFCKSQIYYVVKIHIYVNIIVSWSRHRYLICYMLYLSNQITFISIVGNGSITIFKFYSNGQCKVRGSARSQADLITKSFFVVYN